MNLDVGITLPRLGLGTVAFGRDWGLKYARPTRLPSDAELDRLLATALELGVTLLDTAPAYGSSEERLGRLLQPWPGRFLLGTKAGESSTPTGSSHDFSAASIRASVERSLRRLKVDCVDFVFLHSSGDDRAALGGLETLLELREQGKLRVAGVSSKTVAGGLEALARGAALMLAYNPLDRSQQPVLDAASGRVPVLIKKPLASGHWTLRHPPADALSFAADHPAVSSVIVGTTDPEHLKTNAEAVL